MIEYNVDSFVDYTLFVENTKKRNNYIGLVLGDSINNEGRFYIIDIKQEDKIISLGVATTAEYEQCSCVAIFNKLFIGYNAEVAMFENWKLDVIFKNNPDYIEFYEFAVSKNENIILAIFELGVIAFDNFGKELWRWCSDDIIIKNTIDDINLELLTFEGHKFILDIRTGDILK